MATNNKDKRRDKTSKVSDKKMPTSPTRIKSIITVIVVLFFFISSLALSIWITRNYLSTNQYNSADQDKTSPTPVRDSSDVTPPELTNETNDYTITYDFEPPTPDDNFFELQPTIGDQPTYIVHPIEVNGADPPTIVIYSHGQITHVSDDFTDPFMLQLRDMARLYTENNFIFAASEQHGENFGNAASVNDTKLLGEWIEEKYGAMPQYHLIGFSMGGLPSLNFAREYPDKVASIALHAPATHYHLWSDEDWDTMSTIPIMIWHGQDDVNIQHIYSQAFYDDGITKGLDIEINLPTGVAHFEIEEHAKEETMQFFIENQDTDINNEET